MAWLVALFGVLIAGVGATGLFSPPHLLRLVRVMWRSQRSVAWVVVFRLVLGAVLLLAASVCRIPWAVRLFGGICIIGGVALPLVGPQRTRSVIDWWSSRSTIFLRAWSLVALTIGALLIYAGAT